LAIAAFLEQLLLGARQIFATMNLNDGQFEKRSTWISNRNIFGFPHKDVLSHSSLARLRTAASSTGISAHLWLIAAEATSLDDAD